MGEKSGASNPHISNLFRCYGRKALQREKGY